MTKHHVGTKYTGKPISLSTQREYTVCHVCFMREWNGGVDDGDGTVIKQEETKYDDVANVNF